MKLWNTTIWLYSIAHAWVEAYLPFYGWLGFDPSNNCIATEKHVRLAVGWNFSDCSPVKGTYRGVADNTLEVQVSVQYEDEIATEQEATTKFIHLSAPEDAAKIQAEQNQKLQLSFSIKTYWY